MRNLLKVLFVYRTYGEEQANPVVQNQIMGLQDIGVDIYEYRIISGGIKNYLKSVIGIRRVIKKEKVKLIHAHYSLSGFVSSLAFKRPVICSLMGSDVLKASKSKKRVIGFFVKYFWKKTIVKSEEMASSIKGAVLVPNGVDLNIFKEMNQEEARKQVGFRRDKVNIIFVATDIYTPVKNFELAKKSVSLLPDNYILHAISIATITELSAYYNAADLLLLTSDSEGSPNVIKEALAANCPILSTDVGDVKGLIDGVKKCKIIDRDPEIIASTIKEITNVSGRTNGRDKVKMLSIEVISKQIRNLYLSSIS